MDKKDIRDIKWFFFFLTAFFIFLPLLINLWMVKWHIATGPGLGNAEWLGFWGSYIGSILGVMATFLAFLTTYLQNKKQHHQTRELAHQQAEQNKRQHQQTQQMMTEQIRLSVLPLLDICAKISSYEIDQNPKVITCFDFATSPPIERQLLIDQLYSGRKLYTDLILTISNVGTGTAFQVYAQMLGNRVSLKAFQIGDTKYFAFRIPIPTESGSQNPLTMEIKILFDFTDLIGNHYRQNWNCSFDPTYSPSRPKTLQTGDVTLSKLISN